jgi:Flp pilus assembly protein TadG
MMRRFFLDRRGTAGAEMALVLPFLLVLMFGSFEAGHFFWTEHKLVKAVRDGARYASRLNVGDLCNGATANMSSDTEHNIKLITTTGQLADDDARPLVPGWTADEVQVTISCQSFLNTGIYTDLGAAGPIVTVSTGTVAYPSFFQQLGVIDSTFNMGAKASAAVTGI